MADPADPSGVATPALSAYSEKTVLTSPPDFSSMVSSPMGVDKEAAT
jgi:hypothetical protein